MSKPRQSRVALVESWRPLWQRLEAEGVSALSSETVEWVKAEIASRMEGARKHVLPGTEPDDALVTILTDPVLRYRLREAMGRFVLQSSFRFEFRQKDVKRIAKDLDKAEADLRDLMQRIGALSDELRLAMVIFGSTAGAPEQHKVRLAAADAFYPVPDSLAALAKLARHARQLEAAVLAAHPHDAGGGTTLASKLQGDERERFVADLATLWRDTGRTIPKRDEKGRAPFWEFVAALHRAIGAGEMPEKELRARITAIAG